MSVYLRIRTLQIGVPFGSTAQRDPTRRIIEPMTNRPPEEPLDEDDSAAVNSRAASFAAGQARRRREAAARPLLDQFAVDWDAITLADVEEFRALLATDPDELSMQRHLETHPMILVQHLGGGHGRWSIPEVQLGNQLRVDFMLAEASSVGFEWTAVELESPRRKMFNANGDMNQWLNHAIRQIIDARTWLAQNLSYANNPRDRGGLGLVDVDGTVAGLIVIGRRADGVPSTRLRRRQLMYEHRIRIHSYDWLLTNAERRCEELRRYGSG
jgi:hypothetical protein